VPSSLFQWLQLPQVHCLALMFPIPALFQLNMKLAEHTHTLEERINAWIKALETNYYKRYPNDDRAPDYLKYEVRPGVKYYKLCMLTARGNGEYGASVHAFIHRQTGAVFKPASWKQPAKHVRYNLMDDASYQDCLARADWAGSDLYIR
jgi:hypothetical protein